MQAQDSQAAASRAAGELKRLRGAAADSKLRFGTQIKDLQNRLKAAETSLRCKLSASEHQAMHALGHALAGVYVSDWKRWVGGSAIAYHVHMVAHGTSAK